MKRPVLAFAMILILSGCQAADKTEAVSVAEQGAKSDSSLPALTDALTCLSGSSPIIALHRGRDKGKDQAENALQTLKTAHGDGFIMAEIDVAQTKDGTLFLFHDGVWEEKTTGKGVVAASSTDYLDKVILKTPRGKLTSYRPSRLKDVLDWSKDRIYLEIDFKSSANERDVVELIQSSDMGDQVVLISYNDRQAQRLSKLAPGMMISTSNPNAQSKNPQLAWLGTDGISNREMDYVTSPDMFTTYGQFSARRNLPENWRKIDILVTDYPSELRGKLGQNQTDRQRLESCP